MSNEELLIKLRRERMELRVKIIKLDKFRGTNEWNKLSVGHKQLLDIQLQSMRTYYECLVGRCIDILENKNKESENSNIDTGKDKDHHVTTIIEII
jgi:uncharacterized protein with NRDE domain